MKLEEYLIFYENNIYLLLRRKPKRKTMLEIVIDDREIDVSNIDNSVLFLSDDPVRDLYFLWFYFTIELDCYDKLYVDIGKRYKFKVNKDEYSVLKRFISSPRTEFIDIFGEDHIIVSDFRTRIRDLDQAKIDFILKRFKNLIYRFDFERYRETVDRLLLSDVLVFNIKGGRK